MLYHGTLKEFSRSIQRKVDVSRGRPQTDFGRGFYTTTSRRQARSWAWQLALDTNASRGSKALAVPVVIRFQVLRDAFASLQGLVFVRGDFHANDYWSLVNHCRSGYSGHVRLVPPNLSEWYDIVAGPVAAVWRTRLAILIADQISFHTQVAADVLDQAIQRVEKVPSS